MVNFNHKWRSLMFLNNKIFFINTILTTALFGVTNCLHGQQSEPVFVCFEFNDPSISALYSAGQTKAESELSTHLATRCLTNMRFWSFQAGNNLNFPQLRIFLEKSVDLRLVLELRPNSGQTLSLGFGIIVPAADDKRIPVPNAAA